MKWKSKKENGKFVAIAMLVQLKYMRNFSPFQSQNFYNSVQEKTVIFFTLFLNRYADNNRRRRRRRRCERTCAAAKN